VVHLDSSSQSISEVQLKQLTRFDKHRYSVCPLWWGTKWTKSRTNASQYVDKYSNRV